jgi:hypothetical protein
MVNYTLCAVFCILYTLYYILYTVYYIYIYIYLHIEASAQPTSEERVVFGSTNNLVSVYIASRYVAGPRKIRGARRTSSVDYSLGFSHQVDLCIGRSDTSIQSDCPTTSWKQGASSRSHAVGCPPFTAHPMTSGTRDHGQYIDSLSHNRGFELFSPPSPSGRHSLASSNDGRRC